MIIKKMILILCIQIALIACSAEPVHNLPNTPKSIGYEEIGKASFYAKKFQGRKTASGEKYDHHAKTAAHRKLPFGTRVKVTNIKNKKSVIVRINDRGPYAKGRIIDLSRSAFSSIGSMKSGVINVAIEVVE